MKPILMLAAVYAAFLADVAVQTDATAGWAPNLTLLAGLVVMRGPGGLGWVALAGLLCDCLDDRPLGTTMLVATLVVALTRQSRFADRLRSASPATAVFLVIAIVELMARALAGVVEGTNWTADLAAALSIATTSAAVFAVAVIPGRMFGMRGGPATDTSSAGPRPACRLSGRG